MYSHRNRGFPSAHGHALGSVPSDTLKQQKNRKKKSNTDVETRSFKKNLKEKTACDMYVPSRVKKRAYCKKTHRTTPF